MSRPFDSESRAGALIDAINCILVRDGITALTIRRIAEVSGVSTGSVMSHFGSRQRLLRLAALRTVAERVNDVRLRSFFEGIAAFLPADERDLPAARAYLAWLDWWLVHGTAGSGVTKQLRELRWLLATTVDSTPDDDHVVILEALIHGLLHALCRPAEALELSRAREVLNGYVSRATSDPPAPARAAASARSGAPAGPPAPR